MNEDGSTLEVMERYKRSRRPMSWKICKILQVEYLIMDASFARRKEMKMIHKSRACM
jgi:hypothetical protein